MEEKKKKHPGGRPDKYDPHFHAEDYIKRSKDGDSKTEICAAWMVDPQALDRWQKKFPEFKRAVRLGKSLVKQHYIDIGRSNLRMAPKEFNTGLYALLTRNLIGWGEKSEVTVKEKKQPRPLKDLTDEELDAL